MIKKLLSLPKNLVKNFHSVGPFNHNEWFCTSDPSNTKIGSGGGTAWLLEQNYLHDKTNLCQDIEFNAWLSQNKRIIIHAGGQSRRLPSYAPSGKILTPIPVFRWARGQHIDQTLLDLQLPLLENIISNAPSNINTLIASGDVFIRTTESITAIPDADVVCYGLWGEPALATNHGVFISDRKSPSVLKYMLQKPSTETLDNLIENNLFLIDVGIWLLSDRAVKLLIQKSHKNNKNQIGYYDLYSDFGLSLGEQPSQQDPEINQLTVAIQPLNGGEFYHYGTSKELISSTLALQNIITDQRNIIQRKVKVHPAIFTQNAELSIQFSSENAQVWIENSFINHKWKLADHHILTGIPYNDWTITVPSKICIDVVPIKEKAYALRPYGFFDTYKGAISSNDTKWMGKIFRQWCMDHEIPLTACGTNDTDIQKAKIFPICDNLDTLETILHFMLEDNHNTYGRELWLNAERLSADELSAQANLTRLFNQRAHFLNKNIKTLANNYKKSIFYQLDLSDLANKYTQHHIELPQTLPEDEAVLTRMHDLMFRSQVMQPVNPNLSKKYEDLCLELLRQCITDTIHKHNKIPRLTVYPDQIVWSRSPVRIDIAGGWTDTPPQCFLEGGNVVNMAIELNGQPPIQVYIKPTKNYQILLRSIDLGDTEIIHTWNELRHYDQLKSPFSIPKAALALAGFLPEFSIQRFDSLQAQLKEFGSGLEITILSAIPAGSGLGTSSILAATVLGAINDFCGLGWDKNAICQQTFILEQLLTSGGGWQDQYGGVFHGIKLLQTAAQMTQEPTIRWAPNHIFTDPLYKECHLLYYTGITRVAKNILSDIVRNMFLNANAQIDLLSQMKQHALDTFDAIQLGNFTQLGLLVGKTWKQNQLLDIGTNPASIASIITKIRDYTLGYKLPGAGGGGYLYMIAKDPIAARRIKEILTQTPPNNKARFVDMNISTTGLQISRS